MRLLHLRDWIGRAEVFGAFLSTTTLGWHGFYGAFSARGFCFHLDVLRSTGMWRSLWLGKWSGAFENNNLPFLLTWHVMTAKFLAKYWLDSTPVWSPWDRGLVSNFLESDHLDYCQCCLDTTKIFYLIVHICSQNVMHYAICETQDWPTWEEPKCDA